MAFGFGNRLVSFRNVARQGHAGEHIDTGVVSLSQVAFHFDAREAALCRPASVVWWGQCWEGPVATELLGYWKGSLNTQQLD